MLIGTGSDSTILDVMQFAMKEIISKTGMPSDVRFSSRHCTIALKAPNLSKKVDVMHVMYNTKDGIDKETIEKKLEAGKITGRVKLENKVCDILVPPFEWHQLNQLKVLDEVVEETAVKSIRSLTWELDIRKYARSGANVNKMLEEMNKRNASDLHLRAGNRPFIRVDGQLLPLDHPILSAEDMREILTQLGGQAEVEVLDSERESSFQYHSVGLGYFRCSGYIKTTARALALRHIPEEVPRFDQLDIPPIVEKICKKYRGLFLVCGITGSGKSTTLASMINYINKARKSHIVTIEDPIEFVYKEEKSIISQRQVGRDTFSFGNALRGALREDPDVILVGEMRDVDTIRAGLSAAETGHLVFSTLHTTTAPDTVNRLISYFPQNERDLIRQELAYSLEGIMCQRLLRRIEGGRVPCVEILLGNHPIVREAILEGDIERLHGVMEVDTEMKSFDEYAVMLYQQGIVEQEEAFSACTDEESFKRIISGIRSSGGRKVMK